MLMLTQLASGQFCKLCSCLHNWPVANYVSFGEAYTIGDRLFLLVVCFLTGIACKSETLSASSTVIYRYVVDVPKELHVWLIFATGANRKIFSLDVLV